ncbi:RNA binding motif protein 12Ba [Corythoichthys intestinalis]|uniref:RNA binding motif protein 12Ba n=1 Tax=Corythoichthys intestinalis TaxID=161448 RepID=UPI0025A5FBBB|nr:RNA binding motif protein 12Ba [Corythoichthys intestinalis]XP_057691490.1 RNA binding motif protein 12Ba [Corythoichthys intestinalis]XP_057691491.1 RNA binding motif protein 12Ba [Corythoichthys intestinalis]
MASIVKLKGLHLKADAKDIRDFFPCLHIPTGGICIVGGPQHEAFIAFETQGEARRAVCYSGRSLKGSKVILRRSSVSEMEHKLKYLMKNNKKNSYKDFAPLEKEKTLVAPIVESQTSSVEQCDARAHSPTISPLTVPSDNLRTFNKPHCSKMQSKMVPNGGLQVNEKPCDPRKPPIQHGSLQICKNPCDPRTITLTSGCPQRFDEPPESRILSDQREPPKMYKPLVSSTCLPLSDLPLPYTTHSAPMESIQNSEEPQTQDSLQNAFFLGVCAVLESLQCKVQSEQQEVLPELDRQEDSSILTPETRTSKPGYVRMFGPPASTTKDDIILFFKGLKVLEVVVNMKLEHHHVCLVKFADAQDAVDALQFNNQYMGPICVEVRKATEKMWNLAMEECKNVCERNSLVERANYKHKLVSEVNYKPHKKPRLNSPSKEHNTFSSRQEYIVKVSNLPLQTTKTELRYLFQCHGLPNHKIQHLLDKNRCRTDTAFLIFNQKSDYNRAISNDERLVGSGQIKVSAISRYEMMDMMREENLDSEAKTCLLVQNMPRHMRESLILKLSEFDVTSDEVTILDDDGKASCTVMVQFRSLRLIAMAFKLSKDLLGEKAIIKHLTAHQMNAFVKEGQS